MDTRVLGVAGVELDLTLLDEERLAPKADRASTLDDDAPPRGDRVPELEVDFVLHGDGPASSWAAQAQPGQALIMAGPGPNYLIDPGADWFLLAGDDAALPAIETILDALPVEARARGDLGMIRKGETFYQVPDR